MLDEGIPAWHGKLMAREIADPSPALDRVVQSSIRPLYTYLSGIVGEMIRQEGSAEREGRVTFLCAMSIVGQCLHHFTGKHVMAALGPADFDPADIERVTD